MKTLNSYINEAIVFRGNINATKHINIDINKTFKQMFKDEILYADNRAKLGLHKAYICIRVASGEKHLKIYKNVIEIKNGDKTNVYKLNEDKQKLNGYIDSFIETYYNEEFTYITISYFPDYKEAVYNYMKSIKLLEFVRGGLAKTVTLAAKNKNALYDAINNIEKIINYK